MLWGGAATGNVCPERTPWGPFLPVLSCSRPTPHSDRIASSCFFQTPAGPGTRLGPSRHYATAQRRGLKLQNGKQLPQAKNRMAAPCHCPPPPSHPCSLGRQSRPPRQAPREGSPRARVSTCKSCLRRSRNSTHPQDVGRTEHRVLYPWPSFLKNAFSAGSLCVCLLHKHFLSIYYMLGTAGIPARLPPLKSSFIHAFIHSPILCSFISLMGP